MAISLSLSLTLPVFSPLVYQIFHPIPLSASKQDQLPDGWRAEKFKIYNGGHGRVGLHGYAAGRCHRRGTKLVDVGTSCFTGWWVDGFRFHRRSKLESHDFDGFPSIFRGGELLLFGGVIKIRGTFPSQSSGGGGRMFQLDKIRFWCSHRGVEILHFIAA